MVRLFLRSGKVVAVLGASGGTKITTAVAQVVIILIVIIIVFVVLLLNCASCQILIALILFSVVGDLQGLVSWAGNQRGSRLKEASPPALPKPGDPIIFV